MKRLARVGCEIFLPPLISAVGIIIYLGCCDFARLRVTNIPLIAAILFSVSAIPSIVYTLVMECAFACGLDPKMKRALVISAFVGALLGFGFLAVLGDSELWTRNMRDYLFSTMLGLGCGVSVALLVRRFDRRAQVTCDDGHRSGKFS